MAVSFAAVFIAGFFTILSPCVLPLAPILVAGLVGADHASRWARLRATSWFVLGFSVVFVLLGLGVPVIVGAVGPLRPVLLALSAAILVLYGLRMMRVLPAGPRLAWMDRSLGVTPSRARWPGGLQGLVLGAIFGLTWTPCAGPILGGVLTYVAAREGAAVPGALMLLAYAAGVAVPLLLVAAASEHVTPLLRALGAHARKLELAAGVGLVALGVLVLGQIPLRASAPSRDATAESAVDQRGVIVSLGPAEVERLLFFHSEHCPTCRAMDTYLPALERECRSDRWQLVKVDVDQTENAPATARFAVRAVPTVSLLDRHGREIVHLVGYQSEARLRQALEHEAEVVCARAEPAPAVDPAAPRAPTCAVGSLC